MRRDLYVLQKDLLRSIWTKITISAGVNTTNVLTGGFCNYLIQDPAMRSLVQQLFEEVIAVGNAVGADLPITAAEQIEYAVQRFPECKFSMLQVAYSSISSADTNFGSLTQPFVLACCGR